MQCAAAGYGNGGARYPGAPRRGPTTFADAGATFTITRSGGESLSWSSSVPVGAVLVRGGGATQPWPVTGGRATTGDGARPPGDGTRLEAIDDVTFCFAPPPGPPPPAALPLGLTVVAQGTFTRAPAAVAVRGTVTITNPNARSSPMSGLDVQPSTKGSCAVVVPIEVPSGVTPIAFTCDIDIADAARHGTVDVFTRSGSAPPAATTVRWAEARS